ncbi:ankyrin repeat domain-containing protein [Neorickettsia risticii]|nr:ankyrin repeat domain-containing protein [Neorickettsia risticii]
MMYTEICKAIECGDVATLKLLIQAAEVEGASDTATTEGESLWSAVDSEGRSILQLAVEARNAEVLKCVTEGLSGNCLVALCAKKTNADCSPFPESTPLHTAIALGDLKILGLLLDKISNARGQDGEVPSSSIAAWHTVNANDRTPLAAALASGNIEVVRLVLRAMKTLERNIWRSDGTPIPLISGIVGIDDIRVRGDNALNIAVSTGNPAIVKALVDVLTPEELVRLLTRCNLVGDTALDQAAREGNAEIVRILLKKLGALYKTWIHTPFQVVVESCAESKDEETREKVPDHFSMRLLGNAISSGNAQVVKELLGPLPAEDRYMWLSRTSWGYSLAPLHLAFSLGAHECVGVMLDSLVFGPDGSVDYVSRMLAQRSDGLTPLHCAIEARSVEAIQRYDVPREVLFKLLTSGASDCSPDGSVFVPDGMNPLQAMLAGPGGDGSPVPGAVGVMRAMLDLLEGDPALVQCALSSMDGAGRSTLYTLASLVGSRGVSASDFVSMIDYLESRVNLRTLLEQKNMAEGVSVLDVTRGMEYDLYSWSFSLNDCVSRALNKQEGISKCRASRLMATGGAVVLASFFFFCVSGFAAVCSALYAVCSAGIKERRDGLIIFGIACFVFAFFTVILFLTFSHIAPGIQDAANRYAVIAGDPGVGIPEPAFNVGVSLDANREVRFRPENIEKTEARRFHLRRERDPLRVFSSSPSASSTPSALSVDLTSGLHTFQSRRLSRSCSYPGSVSEKPSVVPTPEDLPGTSVQASATETLPGEQDKGLGE